MLFEHAFCGFPDHTEAPMGKKKMKTALHVRAWQAERHRHGKRLKCPVDPLHDSMHLHWGVVKSRWQSCSNIFKQKTQQLGQGEQARKYWVSWSSYIVQIRTAREKKKGKNWKRWTQSRRRLLIERWFWKCISIWMKTFKYSLQCTCVLQCLIMRQSQSSNKLQKPVKHTILPSNFVVYQFKRYLILL